MSHDLHGSCPDSCLVASLVVDMIDSLAFPDGEALLAHAERIARGAFTLAADP